MTTEKPTDDPGVESHSRRAFLRAATLAGALGAACSTGITPLETLLGPRRARAAKGTQVAAVRSGNWSSPSTWGGRVPGPGDTAIVHTQVLLDSDADVAGVKIAHHGALRFPRRKSRTLRTRENVVVEGALHMRPKRPGVVHKIVFEGVDESKFVGGGMDVLPTDVGLWVIGHGRLDIAGTSKRPWTRLAQAAGAGAGEVVLEEDPNGWRAGDEIAVCPTTPPSSDGFSTAFDVATIRSIQGRTVHLEGSLSHDHPRVDLPSGGTVGAEVLNLTRNVRIEGTPGGRVHIFIHSHRAQKIHQAAIRYAGPRQGGDLVLGRYGIHFHMCENGSRGTQVKGVVIRDTGSHSFVPHHSNGAKFKGCIAYDVMDDAYWWDPSHGSGEHESHDITYDRCVAALVKSADPGRGFLLTGFRMEEGNGNVCRNSVAVGVQGNATASGFHWPEGARNGLWTFEDCMAHNNNVNGIYAWQNNGDNHDIVRFDAYRNGKSAVLHGAYQNVYRYTSGSWHQNGGAQAGAGLTIAANDKEGRRLTFRRIHIEQDGGLPALRAAHHVGAPQEPTLFHDCTFNSSGSLAVIDDDNSDPTKWDFVGSSGPGGRNLEPSDFRIQTMHRDGVIRVQRLDNQSAWRMNASGAVEEVAPFFS